MSAAKVTPWFAGSVKPVRKGVYEREIPTIGKTAFWHWSGKRWDYGGQHEASDVCKSRTPALNQDLRWRGLAYDPSKATA